MTNEHTVLRELRRILPDISAAEIRTMQNDALTLQQLRILNGELLDSITALLYKHDPENVVLDQRELEYDGEAGKILLRLPCCSCVSDCQRVIHEEMIRAFDNMVKPLSEYAALANDVWRVWSELFQE